MFEITHEIALAEIARRKANAGLAKGAKTSAQAMLTKDFPTLDAKAGEQVLLRQTGPDLIDAIECLPKARTRKAQVATPAPAKAPRPTGPGSRGGDPLKAQASKITAEACATQGWTYNHKVYVAVRNAQAVKGATARKMLNAGTKRAQELATQYAAANA